jgi:hypothetical protein
MKNRGMTMVKLAGTALLLVGALTLSGCVTINIYFPAAAAEKAADRIIDEVWQLKNGAAPKAEEPAPAPGEQK